MATLNKVGVDITVVLGTTTMPVHQVLRLGRGAVIELDTTEEDAVSVLASTVAKVWMRSPIPRSPAGP